MTTSGKKHLRPSRRRFIQMTALWPWAVGCAGGRDRPEEKAPKRFDRIGIVLVVDAVPGAEMWGVNFHDDRGVRFFSPSLVSRRTRAILALGGFYVPQAVEVTWRDKTTKAFRGTNGSIDWDGPVLGRYTVLVAERIPDAVLGDIRANGGALRLKFRLKPDGVLFGWDIERRGGGVSRYDMPGGDFLETKY